MVSITLQGVEQEQDARMSALSLGQAEHYCRVLGEGSSHPRLVLDGCMSEHGLEDDASKGRAANATCVLLDAAHELVLLILGAAFQQVPQDVMANRVARKRAHNLQQVLDDFTDLSGRTYPQQVFDDPGRVAVLGSLHNRVVLVRECIDDELEGLRPLHRVDDLLYHVVSMRTTHDLVHVAT
eukprot:CAMPEP_0115749562 /NCGR_PEP_ID=MMETSP0272-20121206/94254_1 /TAXON_ID=71861 /ORGANISM="Scrippsiella trochoidea, Strain CCMP3099" /LENGTH=181 /DNA_ID=CAMNT_0003194613 /DNA_START=146 /DNA_END=691 /DNA_ORIENTATION=+